MKSFFINIFLIFLITINVVYASELMDNPDEGEGFMFDAEIGEEVPIKKLCPMCKDSLVYFWKGIENRTSLRYFK